MRACIYLLLTYNGNTYRYERQSKTSGTASTHYDYDVLGNLKTVTLADGTVIDYLISRSQAPLIGIYTTSSPVQKASTKCCVVGVVLWGSGLVYPSGLKKAIILRVERTV